MRTRVGLCLAVAGLGVAAVAATTGATAGAASKPTITVASWGGGWTAAEKKYFGDPFTKATGIKVKYLATSASPTSDAQRQAQTGKLKIDVVDTESPEILRSAKLLATWPAAVLKSIKASSRADAYDKNLIKFGQTAVVIACNPALVKKCPTSPKQFWDVKDYPGTRGILTGLPSTVMDFALVADGVAPAKVYPMDIDRAIKSLEKIKPDVQEWPASPSEAQQKLLNKNVAIMFLPHGGAAEVKKTIKNLVVGWSGAMTTNDSIAVMDKAPNKDAAFQYIKWIADHSTAQAEWSKAIGYATPTKKLKSLLPKSIYSSLPAAHNVTPENDKWLVKNLSKVQKAFQEFIAG